MGGRERREERDRGRRESRAQGWGGRDRQGAARKGGGGEARTGPPPAEFILCEACRPKGHIAGEQGATHAWGSNKSAEQS